MSETEPKWFGFVASQVNMNKSQKNNDTVFIRIICKLFLSRYNYIYNTLHDRAVTENIVTERIAVTEKCRTVKEHTKLSQNMLYCHGNLVQVVREQKKVIFI